MIADVRARNRYQAIVDLPERYRSPALSRALAELTRCPPPASPPNA